MYSPTIYTNMYVFFVYILDFELHDYCRKKI